MFELSKRFKKSKILSFVLVISMLASVLPMNIVFANGGITEAIDIANYNEEALKDAGWIIERKSNASPVWESKGDYLKTATSSNNEEACLYNHGYFGDMSVEFEFSFGGNNMDAKDELYVYAKKTDFSNYSVKVIRASTGEYLFELYKGNEKLEETTENLKIGSNNICTLILSANGKDIDLEVKLDGKTERGLHYEDEDPLTTGGYGMSGKHRSSFQIHKLSIGAVDVVPTKPNPVVVKAQCDNKKVILSWDKVEDAIKYTVYKGTTESSLLPITDINNSDTIVYEDNDVVNETTYYYVVTATNEVGESNQMPPVSCTPVKLDEELDPPMLEVVAGTESAFLSWSEVDGANGYNVYMKAGESSYEKKLTNVKVTSASIKELTAGEEYTFMVRTISQAESESKDSNEVKVFPTMPPKDGILNITSDGFEPWNESLYAKWIQDDIVDFVEVYYKEASASNFEKVDQELIRVKGNEGRVDIVGLKKNTNYNLKLVPFSAPNFPIGGAEQIFTAKTEEFDRSGYAHFNYTEGVGAYKNDGTPKDNAIIVYLTEENKDTLQIPGFEYQGSGIGWILNNNPQVSEITKNNALIIRVIGKVTNPDGSTIYDSEENGGSIKDNGHMVRMKGGQNITIEGIGTDALIYDWGIHFLASEKYPAKSFEVRNITFSHYPEDALGMEGVQKSGKLVAPVERCWIHNNTFKRGYANPTAESDKKDGDGSCDFKRGEYYTLSYNYFENPHKTNLIGASDDNIQSHITFHHNFWEDCDSRAPLVRQANIHIYNNYFKGNTSKTVDTRANSYAFLEGNYFDGCKNPVTTNSGSAAKSYGDIFYGSINDNNATIVDERTAVVANNNKYPDFDTNSSIFYYDSVNKKSNVSRLTDAITAKAECIAYSGVLKEISVIPEIPSLVTQYPSGSVMLPYEVDLTNGGLAEKTNLTDLSAGNSYEIENVIYKPAKNYKPASTGNMTIRNENIVFTIAESAVVTINAPNGTYVPTLVSDKGFVYLTGSGSVKIPAGTYVIESSLNNKDALLSSFSIIKG